MAATGFRRFLYRLTDREPVVVFSVAIGLLGISMPLIIVPMRESAGYDTSQYNGRSNNNRLWLRSYEQNNNTSSDAAANFTLSDGIGSIPVFEEK